MTWNEKLFAKGSAGMQLNDGMLLLIIQIFNATSVESEYNEICVDYIDKATCV